MDANGVNMVAIGLEQLGAQEFLDGNFFDGGPCVLCVHVCVWVCECTCVYMCVCLFVGSYLATEVFIGDLPATGRGWVIKKLSNDEQRSTTNKLVTWH